MTSLGAWGASSDAYSALQNKGLYAPGSELLGNALESLNQAIGPRRDVRISGWVYGAIRNKYRQIKHTLELIIL